MCPRVALAHRSDVKSEVAGFVRTQRAFAVEGGMSASIEWLGFAAITLSVMAYLPQVTHLIKEHCSAGLSPGAYFMWVVSAVLLLAYSIAKNDPVFISLQGYQAAAGALILFLCLRYKGQLCEEHGGEPLSVRLKRSQGSA